MASIDVLVSRSGRWQKLPLGMVNTHGLLLDSLIIFITLELDASCDIPENIVDIKRYIYFHATDAIGRRHSYGYDIARKVFTFDIARTYTDNKFLDTHYHPSQMQSKAYEMPVKSQTTSEAGCSQAMIVMSMLYLFYWEYSRRVLLSIVFDSSSTIYRTRLAACRQLVKTDDFSASRTPSAAILILIYEHCHRILLVQTDMMKFTNSFTTFIYSRHHHSSVISSILMVVASFIIFVIDWKLHHTSFTSIIQVVRALLVARRGLEKHAGHERYCRHITRG